MSPESVLPPVPRAMWSVASPALQAGPAGGLEPKTRVFAADTPPVKVGRGATDRAAVDDEAAVDVE